MLLRPPGNAPAPPLNSHPVPNLCMSTHRSPMKSSALKKLTAAVASALVLTFGGPRGRPRQAHRAVRARPAAARRDRADGGVQRRGRGPGRPSWRRPKPSRPRTSNSIRPCCRCASTVEQRGGRQFIRVSSIAAAERAVRRHAAGADAGTTAAWCASTPSCSTRPNCARRSRPRSRAGEAPPRRAPARGSAAPPAAAPRRRRPRPRAERPRRAAAAQPHPAAGGRAGAARPTRRRSTASSRATAWAASPPSSSRSTSRST